MTEWGCFYNEDYSCQLLKEHHYKEILSDTLEQINEQKSLVLGALNKEYRNGELFRLMLESAFRGSHGSLTSKQVYSEMDESFERIDKFASSENSAFYFLDNNGYHVQEFTSCGELGYF